MPAFFKEVPEHISAKNARYYLLANVGYAMGVGVHSFLSFLFYLLNIEIMYFAQVPSIALFLVSIYLNRKGFHKTAMFIASTEIVLHQVLCIFVLGWGAGFQNYLILVFIFPFLLVREGNLIKFLYLLLVMAVYVYLYIVWPELVPVEKLEPGVMRTLYYVNVTLPLVVLILLVLLQGVTLEKAEDDLMLEHQKAEDLLKNILPDPIARKLKDSQDIIADSFENTSVLFADIVGFTELSARVTPAELVALLNRVFSRFDDLSEKHNLEKIKTIGDAYMVAAGIPSPQAKHAEAIADMALDMIQTLREFSENGGEKLSVRIGINSGPVVAGVIGKKKFIYDLWGDCVNTAARMESHGQAGEIHVTEATFELLKDTFEFEKREPLEIKGKGQMQTYYLKGRI